MATGRLAWIARQTGVAHPGHGGVLLEPPGEHRRARHGAFEAHSERAQPPQGEPRLEGARDAALQGALGVESTPQLG